MSSSPLQQAIKRGMAPGGDLAFELDEVGDEISLPEDAKTVCEALAEFPERRLRLPVNFWPLTAFVNLFYPERFARPRGLFSFLSPLYHLVKLFQNVSSQSAYDVLSEEGIPQLLRIYDRLARYPQRNELDPTLFILKVLAQYHSREGTKRIVQAARRPLWPDYGMWETILACYSEDHPHRDFVIRELSRPLPLGQLPRAYWRQRMARRSLANSNNTHSIVTRGSGS